MHRINEEKCANYPVVDLRHGHRSSVLRARQQLAESTDDDAERNPTTARLYIQCPNAVHAGRAVSCTFAIETSSLSILYTCSCYTCIYICIYIYMYSIYIYVYIYTHALELVLRAHCQVPHHVLIGRIPGFSLRICGM